MFTIVTLLLAFDLVYIAFWGTEFDQTPPLGRSLQIWGLHLLLALPLTAVAAAVSRFGRRLPRPERATGGLFAATGIGLATWIEATHHYVGWKAALLLGGLVGLVVLGLALVLRTRFRARDFPGAVAVLAVSLFAVEMSVERSERSEAGHPVARPTSDLPHVFFLVVDTLRSDHLSSYGYTLPTTPFLDRIARRSTVFSRNYSGCPSTSPSTAALLGSPFPYTIDFVANGRQALRTMLPTFMGTTGYLTAGFSANPWVSRGNGFGRGFRHFRTMQFFDKEFALTHAIWNVGGRFGFEAPDFLSGDLLNTEVVGWLGGVGRKQPLFCYVHYMGPHYPYTPAPEYLALARGDARLGHRYPPGLARGSAPFEKGGQAEEEVRAAVLELYDLEIVQWDRALGRLWNHLEANGWLENSVVILTSDHGEAFQDREMWGHGNSLYPEVLRVPLVVYRSWDRTSRRVESPVSNTRVMQLVKTIVEAPPEIRRTIAPEAHLTFEGGLVFSQHSYGDGSHRGASVIDGDSRCVVMLKDDESVAETFDLETDPGEHRSVPDSRPDLETLARTLLPSVSDVVPATEIDETRRELLESLGYLE